MTYTYVRVHVQNVLKNNDAVHITAVAVQCTVYKPNFLKRSNQGCIKFPSPPRPWGEQNQTVGEENRVGKKGRGREGREGEKREGETKREERERAEAKLE